jgi:predicted TIM-barrel fold metal-dependent hydrolase
LTEAGGDPSGWYIPPWTIEADKEFSKSVGNGTVILSVTAPGPTIEKDPIRAAKLARDVNEYCAKLRDDDPSGYGFFASVPNPADTSRCTEEIRYALDELNADGVILLTRYGTDNHYLGHADFRPIWTELNRRKAVVLIHPTHPVDTNWINKNSPQPMYDYPHETTRTAMDLVMNNHMRDYRDCKIILSHAGGTMPYLIYRVASILEHTPMTVGKSREELLEDARNFYFDLALSANPITLQAIIAFAKPGHILFGTDYPNAPTPGIHYLTETLEEYNMDKQARHEIYNGAALRLFPRLERFYSAT